jgi:hypothetical protein
LTKAGQKERKKGPSFARLKKHTPTRGRNQIVGSNDCDDDIRVESLAEGSHGVFFLSSKRNGTDTEVLCSSFFALPRKDLRNSEVQSSRKVRVTIIHSNVRDSQRGSAKRASRSKETLWKASPQPHLDLAGKKAVGFPAASAVTQSSLVSFGEKAYTITDDNYSIDSTHSVVLLPT